jgi:hypothetical protein
VFRAWVAYFLSTPIELGFEKEGDKKNRKQAKRGLRREIQGSRWCRCSTHRGVSPPLHASYLSSHVSEAQRKVPLFPPSTHLQLLQIPEAAEDPRDGLQAEVEIRKTNIGES